MERVASNKIPDQPNPLHPLEKASKQKHQIKKPTKRKANEKKSSRKEKLSKRKSQRKEKLPIVWWDQAKGEKALLNIPRTITIKKKQKVREA